MYLCPLLTFYYTQTFCKRRPSTNRVQQPFHLHTRRSKGEETRRGLEAYNESRFEYVSALTRFLVYKKSVRESNAFVPLQVMEIRKSWTWRRRVLFIFSRNCSRWTEERPPLHCDRKSLPKPRQRLPYQRQTPYQHPHRRIIYAHMYFTLLSTTFPALGYG